MERVHGVRFLKVKIKSLAEEAKIIRKEERKSSGSLRDELHVHKVLIVRPESRATLLAYAFLRGRTYVSTESKKSALPNTVLVRAKQLVKKYGPAKSEDQMQDWVEGVVSAGEGISKPIHQRIVPARLLQFLGISVSAKS